MSDDKPGNPQWPALPALPGVSRTGVLVGIGAAAGCALASPLVLSVVGFKAGGVAAGSIAAAIQTPITTSGGFFAACQSAGVLGLAAKTTALLSTTTGATATAGVSLLERFRKQAPSPSESKKE